MLTVLRASRPVGAFLLMLVVMRATTAYGQTTAFTYQGQLSDGGALATGSYDLRFALFDSAMGGAQLGASQNVPAVPVSAGVFTVQLDFGVSAFPGANRFVEIGVRPAGNGSYTTLAPRQQISSSPYAIRTLSAATADALSSACVGCVTNAQIQGVAGSKVTGTIPAASLPTGSGNYIQNTATQQAGSNFNIAGNGVVGGNLTVAGTLNANVSGNFIQNRTTPQAGVNFNVGGNGTVGGVLSAGSVGVGTTTPGAGVQLDVNGAARVTGGGSGQMLFGTPNGETGMSILVPSNAGPLLEPNNRADVRFDGTTLKLLARASPATGPPTDGVVIDTQGLVGIGTANPTIGRLHVVGGLGVPAIYGESANRGVWGKSTGSSRGVYGESVTGEGVFGISSGIGVSGTSTSTSPGVQGLSTGNGGIGVRGDATTGVYGKSTSNSGVGVYGETMMGNAVYGLSHRAEFAAVAGQNDQGGYAMYAIGNTGQARDKGGWVKAMAYVDAGGSMIRCFNSTLAGSAASTVPCGFTPLGGGFNITDYGFRVDDRFISVTPTRSGSAPTGASFTFSNGNHNVLQVVTFTLDGDVADAPFMVIIF
jgi:hypothetical protein